MCYAMAMARLEPFAAIRYNPARVDADDVVSPPYDVVGPPERARLAARSPYNAIHVELPVRDQSNGLDQYQNAARIFRGWLEAGILRRDALPAFYLLPHDLPRRTRPHAVDDRAPRRARSRSSRHGTGTSPRADDPEGRYGPALALEEHPIEHLAYLGALSRERPYVPLPGGAVASRGGWLAGHRRCRSGPRDLAHDRRTPDGRDHRARRERPVLIADGHHRYGPLAPMPQNAAHETATRQGRTTSRSLSSSSSARRSSRSGRSTGS